MKMNLNLNLIDYICIAVLLLFVIVAAVKGFAKIVMHFLAYVGAFLGARLASVPVSAFIYENYIQKSVLDKLSEWIPSGSVGASIDAVLSAIQASLSEQAYNIASFLHLLPEEGVFGDSLLTVESIEQSYVQPIVTKVLLIITTIVLFTVFMIILNIIVNMLDKHMFKKKKGAVNTANRILGGLIGVVQGAIPVGAGCMLLNVVAPLIDNAGFAGLVSNSLFCSTIADIFR